MGGLKLAGSYTNCEYDELRDQAFCRFDEVLPPGATYVIGESPIALPDTDIADAYTYVHEWRTLDDANELDLPAGSYGGPWTRGTEGVLRLVPKPATAARTVTAESRNLATDSNKKNNLAFGYVKPRDRATPSPSPSPSPTPGATTTPTPATTATASPSVVTAGAGSGVGLPVTGPATRTVAGIGSGLLALGLIGAVAARRRRSSSAA